MPPVRLTDSELDAVFAAGILTVAMVFCRRSRMRCNRTAPVRLGLARWPASAASCSGSSSIRADSTR
jgi:hypothetical protein